MATPAIVSWSSGKDSAYALHAVRSGDDYDVVGLLTTITDAYGRVSMHGVREAVLNRQMEELDLPCHKVRIPAPCPNPVYEQKMAAALDVVRKQGVHHIVFGDLFLQDLRAYRETRLAEVGMHGVFPLWQRPTRALAAEMIASGMQATVTSMDPRKLNRSFAGRSFDEGFIADLPEDVDPCGENGEFHSVVTNGPMFRRPIRTRVGDVVSRDGFVFADVALS